MRLVLGQKPQEINRLLRPATAHFESHDQQTTSSNLSLCVRGLARHELRVCPLLGSLCVQERLPRALAARQTGTSQCRHHRGVRGRLNATPEWQTIGNDLDLSRVAHWDCAVKVSEELVLPNPGTALEMGFLGVN